MLQKFKVFQLAKEFHWACKELKLPKFLYDQLFRASASIVLNIAEGSGKRTSQEQRRFYNIALGSLRECDAILQLARLKEANLDGAIDQLGAILFTLSRAPENRTQTETETAPQTEKPI